MRNLADVLAFFASRGRLATGLAMGLLLAGCAANPATGGTMLSLVSESQEIQMGQQAKAQVPAQMGLYDDPGLQAYVDSLGHSLAAVSERPDLPWSFQVVDDPVINAFALPGGPVFLARGILAHFNSEAEMVSVLGHELGHITARHSVQAMTRQQLGQIGLVVGMVAVPELRPFGDALAGGLGLMFLQYGRDAESQSDMLGHRYMTRLGYDPEAAVAMFEILERERQASGTAIPEWQSSHPDPGNRIQAARQRVAEDGDPGGKVGREVYLRHIDGLVYGEDPRQGYFEGDVFVHPELEFRIEFPGGWPRENTPMSVVALSPAKDAMIELTHAADRTPAQAADEFWRIEGLQRVGSGNQTVNGLPAVIGRFRAQNQQGVLEGLVMFIAHKGNTYRLLGYTGTQRFGSHSPTFERVFASFANETNARRLDVEPRRIEVVEVPSAMSVERFNEAFPSTADFDAVMLINGWTPGQQLEAGSLVKRLVGSGGPR